MSDAIVRGSSSDLLSKLEPQVTSLARPDASSLLQARADIQRDPELQALFREAKEKGHPSEWLADGLAARLAGAWNNLPDALEASRYLADEFSQLGEGILIVSSDTGKAIAKLDEQDLYTPAPVPRESGHLAQPLTRIEPGLEGQIISWIFEKGREQQIEALLQRRAHQTDLLKEDGDRRLWIATRNGRARMARAISEDNPKVLLGQTGGTAGAFLSHFVVAHEAPGTGEFFGYQGETKTTLRIHDPTTSNLHYDRMNSMRGVLAQGWVRGIAGRLSEEAHRRLPPTSVAVSELTKKDLPDAYFWVTDPDAMLAMLLVERSVRPITLPVPGAKTTGFRGKVGTIVVPEAFGLRSREIFGRWEVTGVVDCKVYIHDWSLFRTLEITGLAHQAQVTP